MCVLILSATFVWSISHSKKNWGSYGKKTYISLHVKYRSFLSDCSETWNFLNRFSKRTLNINFHEIPSNESRVVPCGLSARHDEANCRFSQFCERA